jgi:quercetin dioxygenase-like cupin family protein
MIRLFLFATLSGLVACAGPQTSAPAASPSPPTIEGARVRAVELPASAGEGEPRDVKVLVDEPALKLVTIVLRGGTQLPEHQSQVAVTIQALHGAGIVTAGGEQLRVDATHAIVLAPKVPHAVAPDPGSDLVLLVHHHGRAAHGAH